MPTDQLLSLAAFAFATSATPGPNTMMLLASGVNFGFWRSQPHLFGIMLGFVTMLVLVGLGLGAVLTSSPQINRALKIASVIYMLWLAWRIATAAAAKGIDSRSRPMTFIEAALFQWVNPKAWAIALAGVPAFTSPERYNESLALIAAVFALLNVPIGAAWIGFGVGLRQLLQDPLRRRIFNVAMALLLVASMAPVIVDLISTSR